MYVPMVARYSIMYDVAYVGYVLIMYGTVWYTYVYVVHT